MRCIFLLLTCLLPAGLAFAQSKGIGTIQGIVVDSTTRKPLLQATVSLVSAGDSAYQTFSFTGGEGKFTFKNVAEGHYRVLVTFVGFENLSRPVAISREKPVAGLDTLFMQPLTIALSEVVVIQERAPVELKGDTIEFNGDSFKTRPNAQVEELLKKLPGVEVSRDGTIRAQGEEVKRVLVDGKPFFGDDPKVATRNLPAEIIDKIQLYDQQSDQSAFSGFDDGNREKTINLTTKKDKRKGVFGQNGVGAGTDGRYQARLNFNRFNKEQQVSVLGLANNLNQQGFTMQDMFNFGAGGPGGANGNAPGSVTGGAGPVLVTPGRGNNSGGGNPGNGTVNNITETWAGGLNLSDAWGRKVDFSGSYFVNRPQVTTDQRSLRQNMLPDTTYFQDQANRSVDQSLGHRLNFRLDYKPDSLNTLRIAPHFSWQATRYNRLTQARAFTGADNPLYESSTRTTNEGDGLYGTNNLLWMRKFRKKGRTFSLNLNTVWNGQDRSGTVQSDNAFFGQDPGQTAPRTVNQRNQQQAQVLNNTVNASYTEPLSLRRTLEVHLAYGHNGNQADRSVYDWHEGSGRYDRPNDSLSNAFDNAFTTQRGGFNVQTRRLKYTYSVGLDVQQAGLRNNDRTLATALGRRFTNLLPAAMFTYHFARNRTLRINYRTRIHAPSVSQLQPVPDNTDPLNLRRGNPDLRPEYVHNATALYNRFEPVSFRTLFAVVNVSRTENKIVEGTNVSPVGVQTTQPLNTDGNYNLNGFLAYGGPLKGIRTNLNLTTSLNYSRGVGRVNDRENLSHNFRVGQGINLQSNWSEKVDVGLSGNVMYQKAAYSLLGGRNTAFFSQYLTLDVHYELPFRFVFTTDFTYNRTSGGAAAYNQQFALWNAGIARQLFKHKQGELKLSVYDLLNQNRSIARNVSDFYVEDVQSRVLRQYYLLSFTYHLRRFSGNAGSRPKGPSFPAVPPPPHG